MRVLFFVIFAVLVALSWGSFRHASYDADAQVWGFLFAACAAAMLAVLLLRESGQRSIVGRWLRVKNAELKKRERDLEN